MTRPKIKIEPEPIDRIVESIGVIGIILLIGLPVFYYSSLPDIIPKHYGLSGEPDGFSGKGIIWTLPAIGLVRDLPIQIYKRELNHLPLQCK